jgi:heme/copper-type cytochrome/quinol oxidase subunit 2
MKDCGAHLIIIAAIAIIVLGIITYFVIRMTKGKVEIELQKRGYNPGEKR